MASAEGQRATAIGSFSFAEGLTSTALGYQTVATKDAVSGTAMGTGAVIDGKMSGAWAAAPHANPNLYDNSKRSIIGGEGNYAIGNENVVGNLTKNSVVFGNKIKIGADGATLTTTNPAGQGNSIKSREETVAYTNATALESVVAIGNEASVSGNRGVAVGNQSGAAQNAVAVGNNAKAKGEAIVAIGQNAGLTSDATSNNTNTRAIMMGVNAGRDAQNINDSILIGNDAGKNLGVATEIGSHNIGLGARALQDASGSTNVALATEAGMGANGNNNFFGQVGAGSYVTGNNNVAIGKNAQKGTSANGIIANDSVVLGTEGKATKDNAVAIGKGALAGHESSVALGSDSETAAAVATTDATINGVTYNGFAGTAPTSTVSIGKSGGERTLTNVAAGRITDTSTDAINGSQLYSVVNGLGFDVNADNNAAKTHKLGKELAIVAGNTTEATSTSNLKTEVTQDATTGKTTVTVSMKEAPNFTSVTTTDAAGNKTVTNGSGVTITPASGNPVSLTTGGLNNGGNKITNVAAGTDGTDAVNVDQLKAAKAAATTKVKAGNGISVNGTQNADGSTTYTVAADTTPLTVANGKVTPPAAADANKLATAGDIANAINNSGFQATAGGNLASGTNATPTTVKPGQKVTFAAGNGLTVKQDIDNASGNQTYTYALDAQSVVQDAQLPVVYTKADGSKVYKQPDGKFYDAPTGGNEVAAGDVIASMQDAAGSTTAPTTLANVKSNLADAGNAVTNPAGNSRADLAGKGNNAATVNDVLNSGFTVQGNGQNKDFVTHGDTINFANGQGTVANVTSTNGVTTVKFDTPMTYADASGNPTSTPSNKVNLVGGTAGSPVTLGNVADGTVAAGSKEAVNGSQLHATNQNVANNAANIAKGINFGGTTGSNNYQLGDTINVKGDSNITSTTVAGGAQLALNPNLNVTSVTTTDAAGNKTVTNGSGVTITPASGNPVSLTTGGLNNGGNKITNVAAGTDGTDAVNVSQLNQALGSITGANTANFTALNNKVNEVAADAKAGTAAAMAVAGLPQAYLPGKSMMAVGGSVYRGESGYAIGYSTISDGGNWIVKGTATGNSRGHYGATAAVGYQW